MNRKALLVATVIMLGSVVSVSAVNQTGHQDFKSVNDWSKSVAATQISEMRKTPLAPKPVAGDQLQLQAMVIAQFKNKEQMEGSVHRLLQDWYLADRNIVIAMRAKEQGVPLTPEMEEWGKLSQALTFQQTFKDNLRFQLDAMANKMQWNKGNGVEPPHIAYTHLKLLLSTLDLVLDRYGKGPVNFPYLQESIFRVVHEYDATWHNPVLSKIMYTLVADAAQSTDALMADHMPMSVKKAQVLAWKRYDEERAEAIAKAKEEQNKGLRLDKNYTYEMPYKGHRNAQEDDLYHRMLVADSVKK